MIVFKVGSEEYAIPIHYILSIEKMEGVTPIPHLPDYVSGIVRVRGELIPVVDLERILYNRSMAVNESVRMIVARTDEMAIGFLVNEAKEILNVLPEQIKQIGLVAYHKTSYFIGIANLDTRLITIIDPSILVPSLEGIKEIQEFIKSQLQE